MRGAVYPERMALPPLVDPLPALTGAEAARTERHAALAGFGPLAQRRLAASRVAVVGAGGLGSAVILALAAAGVGELVVIDDDTVAVTNLHRQVLHGIGDLGRPKTDSAVRAAARLSPTTIVTARPVRLDPGNADRLLADAHVVVDGSDTFASRATVAAACERRGVPLVWGAVEEFGGQATVFWSAPPPGVAPVVLADLHPPDRASGAPSCSEAGVFGPLCLQVGAILAAEAVKLLTGVGRPLLGRVAVIDAARGTQQEIPLAPSRERAAER